MVAIIDHIPRIQLSDIKELIRRQTGTNQKLMQLITLNNIEYRITVSIESKDVVFRWKFKDKDKEVKVKLKTEPSNLGNGIVWYFLCPYTGHKCRKLFIDGNVVASRYAFAHVYNQSRESKIGRFFSGLNRKNIDRKYGKQFYRGLLTPYGKRLRKQYDKMKRANDLLEVYLVPKNKGRKPKDETELVSKYPVDIKAEETEENNYKVLFASADIQISQPITKDEYIE